MDKLTELFEAWQKNAGAEATLFQSFQAGLTAGAVSMRERAVKAAQVEKSKNDVVNKIGALSDIPG